MDSSDVLSATTDESTMVVTTPSAPKNASARKLSGQRGDRVGKRRILIAIYGVSDGTEMVRLARNLGQRGLTISVHVFGPWNTIAARLDWRELRGIRVTNQNGPVASDPMVIPSAGSSVVVPEPAAPVPISAVRRLYRRLPVSLRNWVWTTFYHLKAVARNSLIAEVFRLRRDLVECASVLDREAPDVLVLPVEAVGHHSSILASLAHRRGIPILIVPYSVPVNTAELGERFYYDKRYSARRPLNWPITVLFPEWVKDYRGQPILRLRSREIVTRSLLGLRSSHPWDAGGLQFADAIAVENEAMKDFYIRERFPEERLFVTGSVVDDTLAMIATNRKRLREQLYREFKLDPDRPLVLCAIPPDFTSRENSEFSDYRVLIEHWFAELRRLHRFNVIVCLHPSLEPTDFVRWNHAGLHIAQPDTAELIALCDLYVASVSATIRWAAACGIPVVNYDVYRFCYSDFADMPGILTIETRQAFSTMLQRIDREPDFLETLRAAQEGRRSAWGQLDGHAGERIGRVIERLMERKAEGGTRR